jgi:membrane associated rhomboid family serine protease
MYILAIGAANIKTLIENKNNVWYNAVGASGAVSAVVFAFVLFAPIEKILFFGIIPIPAFLYGLLYLVYSQYMSKKASDNIGHDAHFFGAVFGFVFTGLLRPELFQMFVSKIFNQ